MKHGLQQGIKEGREKGVKEGIEKGIEKGLEQGIEQGEAEVLLRQLERKFGPLDQATIERVRGAGSEKLLLWAERILTAESLEEVFV